MNSNMGESPQDATSLANNPNASAGQGNNSSIPTEGVTAGKNNPVLSTHKGATGTILEAAFVDPAYSWPPADGQGRNAIELQASTALIKSAGGDVKEDNDEISLTPSMMSSDEGSGVGNRPRFRTKKVTNVEVASRGGMLSCCRKSDEQVINTHQIRVDEDGNEVSDEQATYLQKQYTSNRAAAKSSKLARKQERERRILAKQKKKRREARARERYKRVPEGILIYRLDTSDRTITLVSGPSSNTNMDTLMEKLIVVNAKPSSDKSRRGILLTGSNGERVELVACEQRTAIAWLESMDMMLAGETNPAVKAALAESGGGDDNTGFGFKMSAAGKARGSNWAKGAESKLSQTEREEIEERYVNLAAYSNNLIRAGAIPGAAIVNSKGKGKNVGGAGGIYYTVTQVREDGEEYDEETLESIAKRRAVIKDSWDFFRMVCSLLRDKRKYDEVFRRMQLDPVYPYLNSMTGLNDPGDDVAMGGNSGADKPLMQMHREEYDRMSNSAIATDLVKRAEVALPSLVEICKALAGSLGMEEVGVGPVKDAGAALRKAEKKYEGDVLKVTDYCRALLVVKDFSTLLALLELARDSFGPLIRRVKLSTLKSDRSSKAGGYRDCIINLELKEHICEIQIHLWPMWVVCGVDGFRHYRHCLEYSTDTFGDPFEALAGLDRKTMAELIVMAEEAVADMPLETLEWYHEKFILDYFAETGLFLHHGLYEWAETTLRALIKLRCQSPDIGPDHHETITLYKYLEQALRAQKKTEEAEHVAEKIFKNKQMKNTEKIEANKTLWDQWIAEPFESIVDPNKKEREEEERIKKEVRASKKAWRKIRDDRFKFLDGAD